MFWKKKQPEDYVAKKDYKKAISMYTERLSDQESNTALRINLADTLLLDRQIDEALKEYRKAATAFTNQGFVVKAIAIYKKMLKIRPAQQDIEQLLYNLSERMTAPEETPEVKTVPRKQTVPMPSEKESKLLRDLKPEEFNQIVSKLDLRHYEEDTVIIREGDPGDSMFMIVHGEVRVLTKDPSGKNEVFLANLGEGDFFGEIALLTGKPRTATIITNTVSELLELTRKDYESIVAVYPNVRKVMEEFHLLRANKTIEALIKSKIENKK